MRKPRDNVTVDPAASMVMFIYYSALELYTCRVL
jgi:hypothetical protein